MTDSYRPARQRQQAEQPVIKEAEVLQLSLADQIQLAEAILNPPEPNETLRRAFEHRKRLIW